jgi:hypothetical protein
VSEDRFWESVTSAVKSTSSLPSHQDIDPEKPVVLLLDEAKHLLAPITVTHSSLKPLDVPSKFRLLRDALRLEWLRSNVCCVLASTVSSVGDFSPPDDLSSLKHLGTGSKIIPPFYHLDFFNWKREPTGPLPSGWKDLEEYRSLFARGRPLFDLVTRMSFDLAITFVRQKILGGQSPSFSRLSFDKLKTPKFVLSFLVASLRSSLSYNPHANYASDAVASHMAVVQYLSEDRYLLPVLAEAAAQILHETNKEAETILSSLPQMFGFAPIGKGEAGEAIARLLVQLAYDRAAIQHARGEVDDTNWRLRLPGPPFLFSRPIPLQSFISVLCGVDASKKLAEMLQKAKLVSCEVAFTHVVKLTFTPRSIKVIKQGFESRSIFIGKHNQKGYDLLIPVRYVFRLQEQYTCILIQIRNKYDDNVAKSLDKLTVAFSFDSEEMKKMNPELCIYLNVGCDEESETETVVEQKVFLCWSILFVRLFLSFACFSVLPLVMFDQRTEIVLFSARICLQLLRQNSTSLGMGPSHLPFGQGSHPVFAKSESQLVSTRSRSLSLVLSVLFSSSIFLCLFLIRLSARSP